MPDSCEGSDHSLYIHISYRAAHIGIYDNDIATGRTKMVLKVLAKPVIEHPNSIEEEGHNRGTTCVVRLLAVDTVTALT